MKRRLRTLRRRPRPSSVAERPAAPPVPSSRRSGWRELPFLVVMALVIVIVIKTFVVQAFWIPSESMVPTLKPGDRVLVCRFCYWFDDISRGDVIVFSNPNPTTESARGAIGGFIHWLGQGTGFGSGGQTDYIKRVIGLPGDVVEIKSGTLLVNGQKIPEPYLNSVDPDTRSFGPVTVPPDDLFVMGDNRSHSGDSRFPPGEGLGWVPERTVIGQAFVRIWPPSRVGGVG
ncbi:MAG: signal peptidase [Actinomycetota bacterium]|nr:signal peptidase [Actinomycetota bacterium]